MLADALESLAADSALRKSLGRGSLFEQKIKETAFGGLIIRRVLEGDCNGVGRFQADGELMSGASVICGGEKRRVWRHAGDRREVEIAFTVLGGF